MYRYQYKETPHIAAGCSRVLSFYVRSLQSDEVRTSLRFTACKFLHQALQEVALMNLESIALRSITQVSNTMVVVFLVYQAGDPLTPFALHQLPFEAHLRLA